MTLPTVRTGVDVVELDRWRTVVLRTPRLVERIFTDRERSESRGRVEALGGRFAAKEAVMKVLGIGIGSVAFRDIEIVTLASGQPTVTLHGRALERARSLGIEEIQVSTSHSAVTLVAVAVAVAE
ncbi:MAG: holo-ACP synthase [Ferrimicrobium sp.]